MLSGKVALVTGAAQGIGYAIASALISNGAKVGLNHMPGHLYTHVLLKGSVICVIHYTGKRSRCQ